MKCGAQRSFISRRSVILELSHGWVSGMYCLDAGSVRPKNVTSRPVIIENMSRLADEVASEIYTTTLSRRAAPSIHIALTTAGESVTIVRISQKAVIRNVASYRWNNGPEIGNTSHITKIPQCGKFVILSPHPQSRHAKFCSSTKKYLA